MAIYGINYINESMSLNSLYELCRYQIDATYNDYINESIIYESTLDNIKNVISKIFTAIRDFFSGILRKIKEKISKFKRTVLNLKASATKNRINIYGEIEYYKIDQKLYDDIDQCMSLLKDITGAEAFVNVTQNGTKKDDYKNKSEALIDKIQQLSDSVSKYKIKQSKEYSSVLDLADISLEILDIDSDNLAIINNYDKEVRKMHSDINNSINKIKNPSVVNDTNIIILPIKTMMNTITSIINQVSGINDSSLSKLSTEIGKVNNRFEK